MTYHVAVDIGASSGRVILADTRQSLELTEIHRFKNGFTKQNGHDRWNVSQLLKEILTGLEKVKTKGVMDCTIGIDTWAVDYVLLDKEGNLLEEPIAYRDARTQGMMEKVFKSIPKNVVYEKTGIQFLNFNTLYQLCAEERELLEKAQDILLIPDYIAYRLTDQKVGEVTNVSTTQYLNIHSRDYDKDLLDVAGVSLDQLPELMETGTVIGEILPELYETYDLPKARVIAVATHDTGSAVVGVPATSENWAYISSGTWSLIGVENSEPLATQPAFEENYTNEWGAYKTYRFLKNITGMWAVQEIARMLDYQYSFAEMAEQAYQVEPFLQYINLNDDRFTNPKNMIEEIQAACRESNQIVPKTVGELVMCVYSNLALAYAHEWKVLERLTGKELEVLHIVGGGSNVKLLNQLTADVIGKTVIAGPSEATAIGNIMVQMISSGELENLAEARAWLAKNQALDRYEPQPIADRDHLKQYQKTVFE
ncbi:rhamnulokinase [Streptococcus sp. S784/96/1]|uniref:rhamnulokinase n=1 Tax=Streptococcus sp. S784/96/1 TaxID=2653499 RepID=UPI001386ACE5|nr:rhamnulokinase [Streptococcus sp. S784/96/1]